MEGLESLKQHYKNETATIRKKEKTVRKEETVARRIWNELEAEETERKKCRGTETEGDIRREMDAGQGYDNEHGSESIFQMSQEWLWGTGYGSNHKRGACRGTDGGSGGIL